MPQSTILPFACLQSGVKHRDLLQVRSCRIRPKYDLDNLVEVITLISSDSVFFTFFHNCLVSAGILATSSFVHLFSVQMD